MKVLFVCVHNAGRSQMAQAMFNDMASKRGLSARAESAGTLGGKDLNPKAVAAMAELGISMADHRPKLLTQAMADEADLIISMGCGVDADACPAKFLLTEDWALDDPAGESIEKVREIRDAIQMHVENLLARIQQTHATH